MPDRDQPSSARIDPVKVLAEIFTDLNILLPERDCPDLHAKAALQLLSQDPQPPKNAALSQPDPAYGFKVLRDRKRPAFQENGRQDLCGKDFLKMLSDRKSVV